MPVSRMVALLACVLFGTLGCSDETSPELSTVLDALPDTTEREPVIREVDRDQLQQLVAAGARPVLVEFSVLSGCYRCDDMRSPIRQKAAELEEEADVVRIDFNMNQRLAREVGATVCPSYVVYSEGQVASVRTWPTSADFVADDVRAAVESLSLDTADDAEGLPQ